MRGQRTGGASRRAPERRPAGRAAGFSLLEVLVAFVILALVGTTLFRLFGGALSNVSAADDYSRALLVAESVLAETAATPPLREGTQNGSADDGRIAWKSSIAPYVAPQANANAGADRTTDVSPLQLWKIGVDVTFPGANGKPRTFALTTLRLARREAQ